MFFLPHIVQRHEISEIRLTGCLSLCVNPGHLSKMYPASRRVTAEIASRPPAILISGEWMEPYNTPLALIYDLLHTGQECVL